MVTEIKSYDSKEIAYLHNMVWLSHDKREFDELQDFAKDMAKNLLFSEAEKIAALISNCYYLHSLFDDADLDRLSERYKRRAVNKHDVEIPLFKELSSYFDSIYTIAQESEPKKQATLQRSWWYYFSRKDIPEMLRLSRLSIPFFRQQIVKIGELRKGMIMGYILARAGYQHNRDLNKTERLLERYWGECKSIERKIIMF